MLEGRRVRRDAQVQAGEDHELRHRIRQDWTWSDLRRRMALELRPFTPRWMAARVFDRLELQLLLFAEREGRRVEEVR